MMAFENTTKRSTQELINPIDPKKRKVEFAKDVTLYPISYNKEECNIKTSDELDGFSSAIYARFVKSALDDLEKVCFHFFFTYLFFILLLLCLVLLHESIKGN